MPDKHTTPLLSPKFALALQFANEIHATQVRKSKPGINSDVPYISHLLAVSALVLEFGGNEIQAIAALLHDSVEDCGGSPMLGTVRIMFGDAVANIVAACSDSFDVGEKASWKARKEAYLRVMVDEPGEAKLVACADKLHNLSNTLRDIQVEGVDAWKARMTKTKNGAAEKQTWYYLGCLDSLGTGWNDPIIQVFGNAVREVCKAVGTEEDIARANELVRRLS